MSDPRRVYQDDTGQWRWRIVAPNGRTVADSGESYHNKNDALHGLEVAMKLGTASVDRDLDGPPPLH